MDYATASFLLSIVKFLYILMILFFSSLSDKIGRRPVIITGMVLGIITLFPIFKGLTHFVNPTLEIAQNKFPVYVNAYPDDCHFQLNLTGADKFNSSCDIATAKLIAASINYKKIAA